MSTEHFETQQRMLLLLGDLTEEGAAGAQIVVEPSRLKDQVLEADELKPEPPQPPP